MSAKRNGDKEVYWGPQSCLYPTFKSDTSANPRHEGVLTQCAVLQHNYLRIMMYIRNSESVAIFESAILVVCKLMFGSKERRKSPSGLRFFLKARVDQG